MRSRTANFLMSTWESNLWTFPSGKRCVIASYSGGMLTVVYDGLLLRAEVSRATGGRKTGGPMVRGSGVSCG